MGNHALAITENKFKHVIDTGQPNHLNNFKKMFFFSMLYLFSTVAFPINSLSCIQSKWCESVRWFETNISKGPPLKIDMALMAQLS